MGSIEPATVMHMILLCLSITVAECEVYHIVPSENSQCPPDSKVCSTLEYFIVNDTYNHSFETNVILIFSQGWHYLHSELMLVNLSNISMYSDAENVWIICEAVRFVNIYNVTSIEIHNLAFMGCGESTLQEIHFLTIYNCMFQGYHNSGVAPFLIYTKANITRSSFLSNTGTYQFPLDDIFLQGDKFKQVGGAIAAYQSELWITACKFYVNSAEAGGALFIEETTIVIGLTLFENNFAKPHNNDQSDITGGVIVAYWNCYVSINDSTFSNNSGLKILQGVLFSYRSMILVHKCLFKDSIGNVFDIVRSN